jgi:glycosyltransferase involved in cell wall biosynthesis
MTILHLSSAFTWRGGEQQIAYLVNGLTQRGVKQVLFAPKDSVLSQRLENGVIDIETYRKGFSMNPMVAFQLIRLCKRSKVDLIHIHDSHAHNFVWIAYALGLRVPAVLSRRVDFPIKSSSLKKYTHQRIKKIICVSQFIRELVLETVRDPKKVTTVYDGISVERIAQAKKLDLARTFPHLQGKQIVGNIAALAGHKDHDTFVRGVASYQETYGLDGLHFMIIGGPGGEEERIQQLIQRLELQDAITLVGYVENPIDYLLAFDIFLFTSKMEGLGTSVIDAMAAGIPIVSTRAGGLAELIKSERTALSFEVGDPEGLAHQLHRLLSDKELQKSITASARGQALQLSVDQMVNRTLEVYKGVI